MASDRLQAKRDVDPTSVEEQEPLELKRVLSSAKRELEEIKETHRHTEAMKDKEIAAAADDRDRNLGLFGRWLGGPSAAPLAIALLVLAVSFCVMFFCLYRAGEGKDSQLYSHGVEISGGLITLALGYVFGKASSSDR